MPFLILPLRTYQVKKEVRETGFFQVVLSYHQTLEELAKDREHTSRADRTLLQDQQPGQMFEAEYSQVKRDVVAKRIWERFAPWDS
jgi:hypothetical protein